MSEDQERTQLILLRILGVLLVAVGVTMLVGQVRSQAVTPVEYAHVVIAGEDGKAAQCKRHEVHVRNVTFSRIAPMPPTPPAPPALSF